MKWFHSLSLFNDSSSTAQMMIQRSTRRRLWRMVWEGSTRKLPRPILRYYRHISLNQPTNSMDQSPSSEANSHSYSQEIPRLWRKPKVHYRVHKSLRADPTLCQNHPVRTFPPYLPKIHCNIILPSKLGLPNGLFALGFSIKILYGFLISCVLHAPSISSSLIW